MHPQQSEIENANVGIKTPSSPSQTEREIDSEKEEQPFNTTESDVVIRDDGWIWIEELNKFYPPHRIAFIEPSENSRTNSGMND